MKKCILLFGLFLLLNCMDAQSIRLSPGATFSSLHGFEDEYLSEQIYPISLTLGYDFDYKTYFYLTSELGWIRKGGASLDQHAYELNFLHLYTGFRLKTKGMNHVFIGAGPKVDYLIDSEPTRYWPQMHQLRRFQIGAKPEIGFVYHLNERWFVGATGSTFLEFLPISTENNTSLRNPVQVNSKTQMIALNIGLQMD